MAEALDVEAEPSPATPEPESAAAPESSTVLDVEPGVTDRPVENLRAEFNRKLGRAESKIEELTAILLEQSRVRAAGVSPVASSEPDDEELAKDAILGNPKALVALNQRIADRTRQTISAEQQAEALVSAQMGTLASKYPALSDPNSPLRNKVMEAKRALLGLGYPDSRALTLEAIKLAILDNPDLARPLPTPRSANPIETVPGNTPRRNAATPASTSVSKEEAAIARRMGIKDPAKVRANFEKRMKEGKSALGSSAITMIRENTNA